jgi:hypothetical protein
MIFLVIHSQAQETKFPDAAGKPGSTAISKDSSIFVNWAKGVEIKRGYINISDTDAVYNGSNKASFGLPENALGKAEGTPVDVVSLGDSGIAILTFEFPVTDGPGFDFAVFENSFSDTFLEFAFAEVSSDGLKYVRFPCISLTPFNVQVGSFGAVNPVNVHNLAGKYRMGYGTPFDLQDLKDSSGIDLNRITHLKLIDVVGSVKYSSSRDSENNIVNDLFPTEFHNGGFDLDAVGVIHQNTVSSIRQRQSMTSFYPNPSEDYVYFNESPDGKKVPYQLTDLTGKIISDGNAEGNILFSCRSLQLGAGTYILKLQFSDGEKSGLLTVK